VDIESASRDLSDEFTRGVFNPEELNIAAGAVYAQNVLLRFWCAKEAVSKALGTGIRYSPKDMVVVSFNPATGEMAMRLREAWLGAFKEFTGRDIMISSTVVREHVLASCFLPPVKGRESF
jgi:phosphopantetheinyl transferase (holo-ACP synthase)